MTFKWLWKEVYYGGRYRFDALQLVWMGSELKTIQRQKLAVEIIAGRLLENVRR